MGANSNIFCFEIKKKSFDYFKTNSDRFFPYGNSYSLYFCSQFRIPLILFWSLTISALLLFPCIWQGNSKLNGRLLSKFLLFKLLNPSKNQLIPRNPKSLQKPFLCGHSLYLGLKLHQNLLFLQIQPTKSI